MDADQRGGEISVEVDGNPPVLAVEDVKPERCEDEREGEPKPVPHPGIVVGAACNGRLRALRQ